MSPQRASWVSIGASRTLSASGALEERSQIGTKYAMILTNVVRIQAEDITTLSRI